MFEKGAFAKSIHVPVMIISGMFLGCLYQLIKTLALELAFTDWLQVTLLSDLAFLPLPVDTFRGSQLSGDRCMYFWIA